MMKNSQEKKSESDHYPLSIVHYSLFIAIYLLFFFATKFEPYAEWGIEVTRFSFFANLLLPDEYFAAWLGPNSEFSLWDRLPILAVSALFLMAATTFGGFILVKVLKADDSDLTELESFVFSIVTGLSAFSVLISLLFFFGTPPTGLLWCIVGFFAFFNGRYLLSNTIVFFRRLWMNMPILDRELNGNEKSFSILWPVSAVFAVLLILGGMIPSTDYDVLSYHLAGARTFFEMGRIGFVPNDVYANMPFGTEMFFLWGMAITGDVFTGAMVGKTIIAATTIITALGIYAFGRHFFSESAGLVGMFLYMTTPWIFYVSTAGLVDTVVGMYAFFALYAVTRSICDRPLNFLAGFFAGSAAACKYPALLFVVFPLGAYLLFKSQGRRYSAVPGAGPLLIFSIAATISCAGWYAKNWYYTGNPIYPLCFSIFGDSTGTWTPAVDTRWTSVHSPHGFGPGRFLHDFLSVGLTSPWNAPLTIPLALLGIWCAWRAKTQAKNTVLILLAWLVFFFAAWWLLTHRIDRFWLAAVPVFSVLAGIGACWSDGKIWRRTVTAVFVLSTIYCFLACGAPAPGKINRYLAPLDAIPYRTPWAAWFHEHPPEGKILLVGEAKAFLYDVPVLYHSCWNETPLKAIVESGEPAEEFRKRNIAMVLIDWSEIRRFRSPGNYGYSEFVEQGVFDRLVAQGVLERYLPNKELAESPTVVYRVLGEKKE